MSSTAYNPWDGKLGPDVWGPLNYKYTMRAKEFSEGLDLYKLHSNPEQLSQQGVNMDSVVINDNHDHIEYAEFVDGTPLNPGQRLMLEKDFPELTGVNWRTAEVDGVVPGDYPEFSEAFIGYATFKDGTPLTDQQLDQLTYAYPDKVNELAHEKYR